MPAPIQLDGPYYPPLKQRVIRVLHWCALWTAVIAFTVGTASAIALSMNF